MTTENQNTATEANNKVEALFQPFNVNRNGVDVVFGPTEVKKGESKGEKYPSPEVNESNINTILAWVGAKDAAKKFGAFLRFMSQGWAENAEEEATDKTTGQLDINKYLEVFSKLASEFSGRGDSIPQLKAQMDELITELTGLDIVKLGAVDYAAKAADLANQIKDIQLNISLNRRKKDKTEVVAA